MTELKKRKIVTADFTIEIKKGNKKSNETLELIIIGETINEVTNIMYKEENRYHIRKVNRILKLSGKDTFKLIKMQIKQEHGYTNYKI